MSITNYKIDLGNATWVDVNSRVSLDQYPDLVSDYLAIQHSSLFNLFNCIPGQRGRIFQPEYGSHWMAFIHEPISDITAAKMQLTLFESIKRWEPRIRVDLDKSSIVPVPNLPGYTVRVAFRLPNLGSTQQIEFKVQL